MGQSLILLVVHASLALCACSLTYFLWDKSRQQEVPGPILASLSSSQNWYHAVKGDRHLWLYKLHAKYGSIVRFAPKSISFTTVEAVDQIYKSRNTSVIKSDWYQCVRDSAGGHESTFTARDKARHGVKRRLLSHAFSEKALRDYEPRIFGLVQKWVECIGDDAFKNSKVVDMGDWSQFLIFDILGDLCFGEPLGLMDVPDSREIATLVPQATRSWYTLGYNPFTKILRYLLFKTRLGPYIGGKSFRDNGRFRDYCLRALMKRRRAEATTNGDMAAKNDMFHHLLSGHDPETGQSYSVSDLACESVLLLVAGSQSTSGALAATIFYLVNNPDQLERLREEVRNSFESGEDIRYEAGSKLAELPFLRACIQESLRLSPPTPGHLPREVTGEGIYISGHLFEAGTIVGVSAYAMHREQAYFPEPARFLPERWLAEPDSVQQSANSSAHFAFSLGVTGCIGKQLAYMELSLAIAKLVWHFDISAVRDKGEGKAVEYEVKDVFVGEGKGPVVGLVKRRGSSLV